MAEKHGDFEGVRHTTTPTSTAARKGDLLKTTPISTSSFFAQNFNMSLYHEAAQILTTATEHGGSLKSIIFGKKDWKTDRKTLFALSTEAAKWSEVLSEVIEKGDVLKGEKQVRE